MRTFQKLIAAAVAESSLSKHGSGAALTVENFNSALANNVANKEYLANELASLTPAQKVMLYQTVTTTEDHFKTPGEKSVLSNKGDVQIGSINYPPGYINNVKATFESFTNTNKANAYAEIYTSLNVGATAQDRFGECFYSTTPIKQEEAGKVYEVSVGYRYDGVIDSSLTGNFFDKAVNLVDAMYTPDIIFSATTRLKPQAVTGKSNKSYTGSYMADDVAVYWPGVGANTTNVKPIKSGVSIDLFDTDTNSPSITVEDNLDSVSSAVVIEKLVFKANLGGSVPVTGAVFAIDTRNTAGSQILKNQAGGNEYDYTVNLRGSIILSGGTKNLAGTALFAADILDANTFVEMEYSASGFVNLRERTINVTVNKPKVKRAFQILAGATVPLTLAETGNGKKIAEIVTFFDLMSAAGATGYWPNATRANSVGRIAGILVDFKLSKWSQAVDFGSPISVVGSLMDAASDSKNLEMKIETMRQTGYSVISGQAVARLLEQADILGQRYGVTGTPQLVRAHNDYDLPSSHFCMPYFKRTPLDLTLSVNSIKSSEKMMDIQAALLNFIRQEAYEMIRNSRIRAAWEIHHPNKKINIKIGTDTIIARYLVQQGDVRTLGDDITCEIVATDNLSMKNKIILTIGLPSNEASPDDILTFGKHFIAPETIFEIKDSLGSVHGGISRTTWYPRNKHVSMLNVMMVFDVDAQAFSDAVSLATAYTQV